MNKVPAIPWQLVDIKRIYDAELIEHHLPAPYPPEFKLVIKPWFDGTRKFALEPYTKKMRTYFRDLGKVDKRGLVDLLVKLATHTRGLSWSAILACWIGELLSCVYPKDESARLAKRVSAAMQEPDTLWSSAGELG